MKTLALYQLKGGVGKTAAAINLAHCASCAGLRTLLADLDPQGACGFYFNATSNTALKAKQFTQGKGIREGIQSTAYPMLDLLPSHFSYRSLDKLLDEEKKPHKRLRKVLEPLSDTYDLVVIDSPASIRVEAESIIHCADLLLLPVIPTPLSMETLDKVKAFLEDQGYDQKASIAFFSQVDARKSMHREILNAHASHPDFLRQQIPSSAAVERMGTHRAPVTVSEPRSPAAKAFHALWKELNERFPLSPHSDQNPPLYPSH
jgi:cellulose biosynthesis protein BcsQ